MTGDATYKSFDIPLTLETVDLGDILGASYREVVTDGLPVVKPSRGDVEAMLGGQRGDEVIAALPPLMGECTHERLFERDRHVDAATGKSMRVVSTPEDVLLVVTGGNGGKSAFVPLWSGSRAVSVAVS